MMSISLQLPVGGDMPATYMYKGPEGRDKKILLVIYTGSTISTDREESALPHWFITVSKLVTVGQEGSMYSWWASSCLHDSLCGLWDSAA